MLRDGRTLDLDDNSVKISPGHNTIANMHVWSQTLPKLCCSVLECVGQHIKHDLTSGCQGQVTFASRHQVTDQHLAV